MKKMKEILSLAAIFYMVSQTIAVGETVTWTGTASDSTWDTATNWDTSTGPTTGDDVVVNLSGGGTLSLSGVEYEYTSLNLSNTYTLNGVSGSTVFDIDTITIGSGVNKILNVVFDVDTYTVNTGNSQITASAGSVINTLNLNSSDSEPKFFIQGEISIGTLTGTSSTHQLILINDAKVTLTGTGTFDGAFGTNYGSSRTGTLIIASGADQTFTGVATSYSSNDYTYQVYGKFTVNDATGIELEVYNGGTLKVGDASLTAESISFEDGAILEISLEQLSATDTLLDMELLTSSGTVELAFSEALTNGGEYELSLFNDGTDIGSLLFESDWFDSYEYDSITGNLSFTAVPEPSTYALIFGALALGLVAYRKRK